MGAHAISSNVNCNVQTSMKSAMRPRVLPPLAVPRLDERLPSPRRQRSTIDEDLPRFADLDEYSKRWKPAPLFTSVPRPPMSHSRTKPPHKRRHPPLISPTDDRLPASDPTLIYTLCSDMLYRAGQAADACGFAHAQAMANVLAGAGDAIAKHCSGGKEKRNPADKAVVGARLAEQAAADLKAFRAALERQESSHPRVRLVQRLLGWGTQATRWNQEQIGMCLRWVAWVQASKTRPAVARAVGAAAAPPRLPLPPRGGHHVQPSHLESPHSPRSDDVASSAAVEPPSGRTEGTAPINYMERASVSTAYSAACALLP